MENGETETSDHCSFTFDKEFHEIVSDKPVLRRTLEKFLNNMIDEITLGIIFDEHRKAKINGFNTNADDSPITAEQHDSILQQNCTISTVVFNCPNSNCDKLVASTKFATHLEKCMGITPRGLLRKSARRRTSTSSSSKETESPTPYTSLTSDDDDDGDAEWKPGKKGSGGRRRERSRSKKRRGSRKESDSGESVDVDGNDDSESTISSLSSDFRLEYTNGISSPTNSTLSSDSEKRKRDPPKGKKNKNRSYPNSLCDGE